MAFIIKDRTGSKMHRVLDRLASRIFLQLAGIALCLCCQTVCLAGTTNELAVDMLEPGRPAPPGSPPPPGSGDIAPLLTEGDALARLAPPPTGRAGDAATTRFRRDVLSPRSAVNVLMNVPESQRTFNPPRSQPGGEHAVLTIRTDALTRKQSAAIHEILGSDPRTAEPYSSVTVTPDKIKQIQSILYPSPTEDAEMISNGPNSGWKAQSVKADVKPADGSARIGRDPLKDATPWFVRKSGLRGPAVDPLESGKLSYKSQLVTVRCFCRYLVLLGVIFACVFMILAAFGVMQGERNAGGRVTSVAGGLILLLMSYSIWKVVVTNSSRFPRTADQAQNPRWQPWSDPPSLVTDQHSPTVLYGRKNKPWDETTRGSNDEGRSDFARNSTPGTLRAMPGRRSPMVVVPLGGSVAR